MNYTDDIFEAMDLQDEIQSKYTGGTVLHIFAGEQVEEPEVIKTLVRKICHNYKMPYFTFSPTFSVCPSHGYLTGNQSVCSQCGEATEVYSRVVGYLRPVAQWNNGKKEEFKERTTFSIRKAEAAQRPFLRQARAVDLSSARPSGEYRGQESQGERKALLNH